MAKVRTCLCCANDNGADSKRCNRCGSKLEREGTDYLDRWVCSKCGRINMKENPKCLCGEVKPDCFITTLTCELLGKNDNCFELEILRKFRKEYLELDTEGNELLRKYKIYSEFLVPMIIKDVEKMKISHDIFTKFIEPTSKLILLNKNLEAIRIYSNMVYYLQNRYNYVNSENV